MKKSIFLSVVLLFSCIGLSAQEGIEFSRKSFQDLRPLDKKQAMHELHKTQIMKPMEEKYLIDSTITYNWDALSSTWSSVPSAKAKYTYTDQGVYTRYNHYLWDEMNGKWVDDYEYYYVFDNMGNLTEWVYNTFDPNTQTWTPYEHDTLFYENNVLREEKWCIYNNLNDTWFIEDYYRYDETGGLIEEYYFYWDDMTFMITGGSKYLSTLNSYDLSLEEILQDYDTLSHSWVNWIKTTYEYQSDTILNKEQTFYWTVATSTWDLYNQYLYMYSGGLLAEVLVQEWNGTWNDTQRFIYEYDNAEHLIKDLTQTWTGSDWYNSMQNLYSYNPSGMITQRLYQTYSASAWVNNRSYDYVYDNNNNRIEFTYKRWDITTGLLTGASYKYLYTVDGNNLNTETIYQNWNTDIPDWANNYKRFQYYSLHQVFGLDQAQGDEIVIYPNPATSALSIAGIKGLYRVSVYSISGKLVLDCKGTANQIDISGLSPGIYLVKILTQKGIITDSFVKK
jgi:hypothetical protein